MKIHHVLSARKSYPGTGIHKGDEYWWWRPRNLNGEVVRRKTEPKAIHLSGSAFLMNVVRLIDETKDILQPALNTAIQWIAISEFAEQLKNLMRDQRDTVSRLPGKLPSKSPAASTFNRRRDFVHKKGEELSQWFGESDVETLKKGLIGWLDDMEDNLS